MSSFNVACPSLTILLQIVLSLIFCLFNDLLTDGLFAIKVLNFLQCFILLFNFAVVHFAEVDLVFLLCKLRLILSNLHVFMEPIPLTI